MILVKQREITEEYSGIDGMIVGNAMPMHDDNVSKCMYAN